MGDTRASIALASFVCIAVAGTVYFLSWRFIVETGVCCADDAFHAVTAKHLATEGRYGWPLSSNRFDLFPPSIGPGLILPAALAIGILGAKTWVPGFTVLILLTCQMAGAGVALGRRFSITGIVLFIAVLTASLNVISGWQWYFPVLLGELPAFGFILIGTAVLVSGRSAYLAGLAFGAAYLTKQIALFSESAIVLVWLGFQWRSHGWRTALILFARVSAGAATPVLAFELCKVLVLGPAGYLEYFPRMVAMTKQAAIGGPETVAGRLDRFSEIILKDYFAGWNTAAAGVAGIAASIFLVRSKREPEQRNFMLSSMLFAGGLAHLAYVLLVSILWSRYLYVGAALLTAGVASPILSIRNPVKFGYAAAIAMLLITGSAMTRISEKALGDGNHASDLAETVRFVSEHPDLPIASQGWATFYDVLFLLNEKREWVFFWGLDRLKGRPYMVVMNNHFAKITAKEYQATVSGCRLEMERGVYRIYVCGD